MKKTNPPATLHQAYAALSDRYRQGRSCKAIQTPLEAQAYDQGRAPATMAVLKNLAPALGEDIATILDIGAGTGAAYKSLGPYFPQAHWHFVEPNKSMTFEGQGQHHTHLAEAPTADLVILSYVLNEVTHPLEFVEQTWHKVKKTLLITLPGTPQDYDLLMKLRSHLIFLKAHLQAPCPHTQTCPLIGHDWCHFSVRLPRSASHRAVKKATLPFEDEKYCYLIFNRFSNPIPARPRVIKAPRVRKGHIIVDTCQPDGCSKTVTLTRQDGILYKQAYWGMTL